jgi:hypothetical protein
MAKQKGLLEPTAAEKLFSDLPKKKMHVEVRRFTRGHSGEHHRVGYAIMEAVELPYLVVANNCAAEYITPVVDSRGGKRQGYTAVNLHGTWRRLRDDKTLILRTVDPTPTFAPTPKVVLQKLLFWAEANTDLPEELAEQARLAVDVS